MKRNGSDLMFVLTQRVQKQIFLPLINFSGQYTPEGLLH